MVGRNLKNGSNFFYVRYIYLFDTTDELSWLDERLLGARVCGEDGCLNEDGQVALGLQSGFEDVQRGLQHSRRQEGNVKGWKGELIVWHGW